MYSSGLMNRIRWSQRQFLAIAAREDQVIKRLTLWKVADHKSLYWTQICKRWDLILLVHNLSWAGKQYKDTTPGRVLHIPNRINPLKYTSSYELPTFGPEEAKQDIVQSQFQRQDDKYYHNLARLKPIWSANQLHFTHVHYLITSPASTMTRVLEWTAPSHL